MPQPTKPSINELLDSAPWVPLEEHLDHLRQRVDRSISTAHELRERYRDELESIKQRICFLHRCQMRR